MTITYRDGTEIKIGDLVKRSTTSKAVYRIKDIRDYDGQPVIGLAPHSGYTHSSCFGDEQVTRLIKLGEAEA